MFPAILLKLKIFLTLKFKNGRRVRDLSRRSLESETKCRMFARGTFRDIRPCNSALESLLNMFNFLKEKWHLKNALKKGIERYSYRNKRLRIYSKNKKIGSSSYR